MRVTSFITSLKGMIYYTGMKSEQENTVLSNLVQRFFSHFLTAFIVCLMTVISNSYYTVTNYQIVVNNKLERMEKAIVTV
jgi:hypothetical protein